MKPSFLSQPDHQLWLRNALRLFLMQLFFFAIAGLLAFMP
jgi:hypothetical protein